jgi:hypothetical protein
VGPPGLVAALEQAAAFRRFRAGDVRSILEAGAGVANLVDEGEALVVGRPVHS